MEHLKYNRGDKGRFIHVNSDGSLITSESTYGIVPEYLSTFLSDSNGNTSAIANYEPSGVGRTSFFIQPPSGQVFRLARLMVQIEDQGNFNAEDYGSLASPLASGIDIQYISSNITNSLTKNFPIVSNAHWGKFCYNLQISAFGTGNNFAEARWTFTESGTFIRLVGDQNDKFEVILNDNLTGLINHTFLVQGYIE